MNLLTVETVFHVAAAIVMMYFFHGFIVESVNRCFQGPLRRSPEWSFWKGYSRRAFNYIALPLLFGYFGLGVRLLPNPVFQGGLDTLKEETPQNLPYSGTSIPGLSQASTSSQLGIAVIGSMLICCAVRMFVKIHDANMIWTVSYVAVVVISFAFFTFLKNPDFYRLLFDSVIRKQHPESLPWIVATGIVSGLITEYLIERFPIKKGDA